MVLIEGRGTEHVKDDALCRSTRESGQGCGVPAALFPTQGYLHLFSPGMSPVCLLPEGPVLPSQRAQES